MDIKDEIVKDFQEFLNSKMAPNATAICEKMRDFPKTDNNANLVTRNLSVTLKFGDPDKDFAHSNIAGVLRFRINPHGPPTIKKEAQFMEN